MPSSYTTSLRLTLPATGELAGQWGNTVNTGITELLDAAVAGTASISTWGGAGVAYTLSNNSGTADEARKMFIVATGTPGEAKNVICPAVSKFYVFRNDTTGGFALTLKTPSGTGISVPAGQYKFLYCDGTNVVEMFNSVASLRLSSLTSGRVTYAGSAGLLQDSANLTFNGTDLTVSGAVNAGTINATTLDLTNIEVTNIKAKDGTASASIADTTGVMSLVANPVFSGGTANGVLYLNGSKVATSGTALAFNGTSLTVGAGSGNPFARINGGTSAGQGGGYAIDRNGTEIGGVYSGSWYTSGSAAVNTVALGTTTAEALLFGINYSEQMRLTSTGLGIGITNPAYKLVVSNGGASGIEFGPAYSGTDNLIQSYNRSGLAYVNTVYDAAAHRFNISGTEGMRLTSTGLGIGTSSPATKLDVVGSAASVRVLGTAGTVPQLQLSSSGVVAWSLRSNNDGGSDFTIYQDATQRLKIDSSGNLGIGTSSPGYRLDVQGASGVGIQIFETSTGNGNRLRITQTAGITNYQTTYSNSSTNAQTWTIGGSELMRLDSSGNLGIGVTPSAWESTCKVLDFGSLGSVGRANSGQTFLGYNFYINSSGQSIYKTTTSAARYDQVGAEHRWFNAPSGTAGNAISFTQAMTLDASGNLGVGTTSPSWRVHAVSPTDGRIQVEGSSGYGMVFVQASSGNAAQLQLNSNGGSGRRFSIASISAGALTFSDETAAAERARITSGGDFGIGNTNPQYRLTVDKDTTSALAFFANSNASAPNGAYIDFSAASPNNSTQYFLYCEDSTAQRATIRSNGGLANYSANDVNLSDRREKTNFAPAKSYLDTICAIPVQTFNYIDQSQDDPGLTLGVVAQDVQAVAPELVMESNWGTADNPKMRLSIYQTDLQYALMKCVQELKAELDAVKAELATLKGN